MAEFDELGAGAAFRSSGSLILALKLAMGASLILFPQPRFQIFRLIERGCQPRVRTPGRGEANPGRGLSVLSYDRRLRGTPKGGGDFAKNRPNWNYYMLRLGQRKKISYFLLVVLEFGKPHLKHHSIQLFLRNTKAIFFYHVNVN
ncbi:MAG: hypothetical protein LBQ79_03865 [Deltaproteobacteria bacterium]|jgi:hypothetical protein|nr:hypothetical protein [Deltaproteobacteria bacterium]